MGDKEHPKCPQHCVFPSKYQILHFVHSVSLLKVHKSTRQNSLDKAANLLYWIMLSAAGITQILLLVTPTLGTVLLVEKMLVSGVMVSDNYNLFASVGQILHLCTSMYGRYSTTKELVVRVKAHDLSLRFPN